MSYCSIDFNLPPSEILKIYTAVKIRPHTGAKCQHRTADQWIATTAEILANYSGSVCKQRHLAALGLCANKTPAEAPPKRWMGCERCTVYNMQSQLPCYRHVPAGEEKTAVDSQLPPRDRHPSAVLHSPKGARLSSCSCLSILRQKGGFWC